MNLCVYKGAVVLDELVSVTGVSVLVVVAVGSAAVGEEDEDLVDGLWVLGKVVPEDVGVFEVGLWVTLLGVNEVGEFGGVTDEEDFIVALVRSGE